MDLQIVIQKRNIPLEEKSTSLLKVQNQKVITQSNPFVEANTKNVSLLYLKKECSVPVFAKDNEQTISHQEFIDTALSVIYNQFPSETIGSPEIRVSHQINTRLFHY